MASEDLSFVAPRFDYSGPLRPHYVSPMRTVPTHIQRPEYHATGFPRSESETRGSTTIYVNNKREIEGIRKACQVGREVLDIAHRHIRVGITTDEIDRIVHKACLDRNCYPSPLNYSHFPKSCCTSVNEIICHGIPDARALEDGDIVNVDVTVYCNGFHGDLNETYCVGNVDPKYKNLVRVTHDALMDAIEYVKPGVMARDFGKLISKRTSQAGYSVVRSYCGHGIGALFHAPPNIPHYPKNKAVGVLKPGMVFTIEPMINEGVWQDMTWTDDWTSSTKDGKRSAQFEHTILVTDTGYEVLTARTKDSPPLWWEQEGNMGEKKEEKEKPEGKPEEVVREGEGDQKGERQEQQEQQEQQEHPQQGKLKKNKTKKNKSAGKSSGEAGEPAKESQ